MVLDGLARVVRQAMEMIEKPAMAVLLMVTGPTHHSRKEEAVMGEEEVNLKLNNTKSFMMSQEEVQKLEVDLEW